MTSDEPERLPSARIDRITFVVTRSRVLPRTLSLAASPPRPVKGLGGRFDLSHTCPACLAAPRAERGKDASHRLLQPTYDTSTLRSARFPVAPGPKPLAHPGRASLDGEPPASASSRLPGGPCGAPSGHRPFLAGLRSTAPPNDAARTRFCRPRSELVTWPLTLLSRPSRLASQASPGARSASAAVSSKTATSPDQSAFHRRGTGVFDAPARAARSPLYELLGLPLGTQRLDHRFRGDGQAPLVDFCNQNSPRARPRDRLIPSLRREGCPPLRGPGGAALRRKRSRRIATVSLQHQPRFHGSGAGPAFARPAPFVAIARGESFAPARSARTPLVASSWWHRLERPASQTARSSLLHEPTGQARFREARPDPSWSTLGGAI